MIRSTPTMAVRYLKSYGFVLDLVAVLPLEVFALVWSSTEDQWSYFALLRLNRLLKLWKVRNQMLTNRGVLVPKPHTYRQPCMHVYLFIPANALCV